MRFEYWKNANGNWYWHARADNNFIIAQGEGYANKADVINVINIIKAYAAGANVAEVPTP